METGEAMHVEKDTEKLKVLSAEIVVRGTKEKPYFCIKYDFPDEEGVYCLGYGSYNLDFVFNWLRECFEIVQEGEEDAEQEDNHLTV